MRAAPLLRPQLREQGLGLLQEPGAETFGEPTVEGHQKMTSFTRLPLTLPKSREVDCYAQLHGLGALRPRHREPLLKACLGFGRVFRAIVHQDQTLQSEKLSLSEPFAVILGETDALLRCGQRIIASARHPIGVAESGQERCHEHGTSGSTKQLDACTDFRDPRIPIPEPRQRPSFEYLSRTLEERDTALFCEGNTYIGSRQCRFF